MYQGNTNWLMIDFHAQERTPQKHRVLHEVQGTRAHHEHQLHHYLHAALSRLIAASQDASIYDTKTFY